MHHAETMNQNFEKKNSSKSYWKYPEISDRQDSEEIMAIYGAGSYVLSAAYKQFFVPSATWHDWNVERKKDHFHKFQNYKPKYKDRE